MAEFDYNYGDNDYSLVAQETTGSFGPSNGELTRDYIRLSILDDNQNVVDVDGIPQIYYSTLDVTPFTINTSGLLYLSIVHSVVSF